MRKINLLTCSLLTVLISFHVSFGQGLKSDKLELLSQRQSLKAIWELKEFLSIPNNASYPSHVEDNVSWCEVAFKKRNFSTKRLSTGGPPLLLAEMKSGAASKTVLFYLQVDGQPVDSSQWDQESPYQPVIKKQVNGTWKDVAWEELENGFEADWRIFARSAADAKGPIIMFLAALDIMRQIEQQPDYNIKVIMDFEEELGSPHLPGAVDLYQQALAADEFVILDGPRHISNSPTLTFGARGISTVTLKVFGPRVPQHSGHYGNYVPNPAFTLSKLLASLKNDQGRVTIPGYYDGITIDGKTKEILRQVPDDESEIRKKMGIADIDKVATNYQESIQYPSLNVRGMQSGWIGKEVRTIVPATATAEIDIRLVPESNAERLVGLFKKHIQDQGFHIVSGEPSDDERAQYPKLISFSYKNLYDAFRTDFDSEIGQWLRSAMLRAFDEEPVRIRIAGGSIPISPFVTTLGVPAVSVPTVNADNNQHSPNENLRLGNFIDGIKTCLSLLTEKTK
ncbi:MAG: M20/M25/M40 family metallo-hydrolase [Bacteroidota bacterium]